jgi:hypothetical protein
MIEIRFDKTKDEVALLIWFLVDHSVQSFRIILYLCHTHSMSPLLIWSLKNEQ